MQKKKNKHINTNPIKKTNVKTKIEFPKNNTFLFYGILALSFLIPFILYLLTLAPSISFEDSGELIAAAYTLGIPHEPGYPLFTLFGKLFAIIIPFGNIAFRVNMLSAFFTAATSVIICYSMVLILEDTFIKSSFWKKTKTATVEILKYVLALCSALFFSLSFETWEQAVMTEVYGINSFFIALFILFCMLWKREESIAGRRKYLYIISFIISISITNHSTSMMLIPIFGVYLLAVDYKILLHIPTILKSILFFILGFTPFLYLPLASSQNPPMDWGNPENFTNFFRVVSRHQYNMDDTQTASGFISQFKYFLSELLTEQWFPLFILFAIIGFIILYKQNKSFFVFALIFILFSIPLTTYFTNFDISSNKYAAIENGALVSVFYIPSYLFLSVLIGGGLFYLISLIKSSKYIIYSLGVLCILTGLSNILKNYKKVDMSSYHYPEKYVENIFKIASPASIVIGDWDPYCFPFFYYQMVEKKRNDLVCLDIMLLKRSWYIEMLKNNHPDFIEQSEKEVNAFLEAVKPFENGEPYDGSIIQASYEKMIYSFIDKHIKNKKDVYITHLNNPETQQLLKKYPLESDLVAYKISRDTLLTTINYTDLDFNLFINENHPNDRMVKRFKEYYGGLFSFKAYQYESINDIPRAIELYNKALPFYKNNVEIKNAILNKISSLKQH